MERRDSWYALLSETQFAVHQTIVGLRELGRVVYTDPSWRGRPEELRFTIHNGLFSYTTGVERLSKLVLSLAHYREQGQFPSGDYMRKKLGHAIGPMAKTIGALDPLPSAPSAGVGYVGEGNPLATKPDFIALLDDYARGPGRYEYLDSLTAQTTTIDVYERWVALVGQVEPSEEVQQLGGIPRAISDALYHVSRSVDNNLGVGSFDSLIEPYIDNLLPSDLYPESLEVALNYYDFAEWVAAHLSNISDQILHHDGHDRMMCPYLSEVINHRLLGSRHQFAEIEILQLNDLQATIEALEDVYKHIPPPSDEEE